MCFLSFLNLLTSAVLSVDVISLDLSVFTFSLWALLSEGPFLRNAPNSSRLAPSSIAIPEKNWLHISNIFYKNSCVNSLWPGLCSQTNYGSQEDGIDQLAKPSASAHALESGGGVVTKRTDSPKQCLLCPAGFFFFFCKGEKPNLSSFGGVLIGSYNLKPSNSSLASGTARIRDRLIEFSISLLALVLPSLSGVLSPHGSL